MTHARTTSAYLGPPGALPPKPLQSFAGEADRARLTPAALEGLRSLARTWERIRAGSWGQTLSQDQLMRVSAMVGVFKGLHLLFADDMADRWVRLRNAGPLFVNRTPIEAMRDDGIPGMLDVRRHVDALRGGL